jgi:hypothetical protein
MGLESHGAPWARGTWAPQVRWLLVVPRCLVLTCRAPHRANPAARQYIAGYSRVWAGPIVWPRNVPQAGGLEAAGRQEVFAFPRDSAPPVLMRPPPPPVKVNEGWTRQFGSRKRVPEGGQNFRPTLLICLPPQASAPRAGGLGKGAVLGVTLADHANLPADRCLRQRPCPRPTRGWRPRASAWPCPMSNTTSHVSFPVRSISYQVRLQVRLHHCRQPPDPLGLSSDQFWAHPSNQCGPVSSVLS